MNIEIRQTEKYKEVRIVEHNTVVDVGLLSPKEQLELAEKLMEAACSLLSGVDQYIR